jgi:polyisoprenyl-phosphate glycosyltransferase
MSSIDGGASPAMLRIAIVIPVFNDWVSFAVLCRNLDSLSPSWGVRLSILAVDDGSHDPLPQDARLERLNNIDSIEILALACNLGHQRAIAVGLAAVLDKGNIDAVVVTDGDGEDRPEDIGRMIDAHRHDRKSLIVGRRTTRSESASFQVFYRLYKTMFRLFTGKKIDFGNFSLIPVGMLRPLLYMPEAWNHLAATILRSRLPLTRLDCARGKRYAGNSSMNFVSLLGHGMSAVSVFSDLVFVRLLAFSATVAGLAFFAALVAVAIRLTTAVAIPGWATNVVGISALLVFQALTLSVLASVSSLGGRSAATFIPATQAIQFISKRLTVIDP